MAREEKQANIYAIPKNSFDTGYVFGGQFKTRNFVEGVVVTLPFLGIFLYGWAKLGLDFESTVAYCFILCAAVFVSVVHGVGGDSLFEFIARVVKFRQNRRISKYNPRIKTELEPDYLLHDDTMLPKEKLKRALENIKSKVVGGSDEPISADITDEDLQVYYDDDEDFVEKPDELKSKAELKAEAKQRAREEKEFIKSLPRNQRRMARAELKRKHMSEVHNNDIRELLDVIPVIPHNLMMEYLTRQYNMTPNKAREVIYNACRKGSNRRPACYVTNDGLAKADYVTMTSLYRKRCRAFRVACEFLPEGRQFSIPSTCPWLLSFCFEGSVYYVCEFEKGKELIVADVIRNAGIREDMMSVTSRIAIMRPGVNRELLNGCGIRFFCVVDDDYNLEVTEQVPDQEVWDGVPIVK